MKRAYYSDSIANFLVASRLEIFGAIDDAHTLSSDPTQKGAWMEEIEILKEVLVNTEGRIYFEYSIPRMGKRIDVVVLVGSVILVLEFKVGEKAFTSHAVDQVCDYALDLKNFHESSHDQLIAPILVATEAKRVPPIVCHIAQNDKLLSTICTNVSTLRHVIDGILDFSKGYSDIDPDEWEQGRYCPTPTIIEAALALYRGHSVENITRHEADKPDISVTSTIIDEIIHDSQKGSYKSICFVTGVPGAGKTLVGLNTATKHQDKKDGLHSVFLSGNGPLVSILREALARDHVQNELENGRRVRKGVARSKVRAFIQPVHEFRDEGIKDPNAPVEHIVLFDEAQRAWHLAKTSDFLKRRKGILEFDQSEPEFLISCLDRNPDWAVIVCLIGGGQEIHTGEAGIGEWINALNRSFPHWRVYISSRLTDSEYAAGNAVQQLRTRMDVTIKDELHLSVSMRSFRAEHVSLLVKQLLDLEKEEARKTLANMSVKYPIVITRDFSTAKSWLRRQARGTERYGIVASSQAERLKPHAINVKSPMDPKHWFLDGREDVRSSYYLEDVGTEFAVQGLELDWTCVTWDADFRYTPQGWEHKSFRGDRWNRIKKPERQVYQKNAYRVLLTRARQGMVIVVPHGDTNDPTRKPEFYDPTFQYLQEIGFTAI